MTNDTHEPWVVEQHWNLTYRHTADEATAAFFRTLRDDARLVGAQCPLCDRVLAPARSFCDRDFSPTDKFVDLAAEGTIELFTIVYHRIEGLPDPPYAIAYVRPDGADTAIVNFVRGVDLAHQDKALAALAIGNRAAIRFSETRVGAMTDFWFDVGGR